MGGVRFGYGFGWEIRERDELRLSKDGGSWGVSARVAYYPQRDVTLIVLSNWDSAAFPVADWIGERIERMPLPR